MPMNSLILLHLLDHVRIGDNPLWRDREAGPVRDRHQLVAVLLDDDYPHDTPRRRVDV